MKKYLSKAAVGIVSGIFGFYVAGCGTLGNGKVDLPITDSPYQAGRTFVVIDLVTEPIQPDEVSHAFDQVYALVNMDFDMESASDEFVQQQIKALYPEATDAFRQSIFNVYGIVKIRLISEIESNIDLPELSVVSEFMRGVEDALALYRPEE